jgi:hypothetical protein
MDVSGSCEAFVGLRASAVLRVLGSTFWRRRQSVFVYTYGCNKFKIIFCEIVYEGEKNGRLDAYLWAFREKHASHTAFDQQAMFDADF